MIFDPDERLVRRAKSGDKGAFGKLVNHYYEMVYSISYGVLHQREPARDVTQDVFMKVFRDLNKFDGKSKFKTWLYRVTVNASIDVTRKKRPSQSIDATDASDEEDKAPVVITSESPGPRDVAASEELKVLVQKALEDLSADHRAILVLREWQGLSYEEIADMLQIDMGTVMSRLYYARKKLGDVLKRMNVA